MSRGDHLGRDHTVQPDCPGNPRVVLPVGFGDHLGNSLLRGIEGDDHIVLVPSCQRNKCIKGVQVFRFQYLLIAAISADHCHIRIIFAQLPAALFIVLNELDLHLHFQQQCRQIGGYLSAAHNEYPVDLRRMAAQQPEKLGQSGGTADHIHFIVCLRHKGSVGNHDLTIPVHRAKQNRQFFHLAGQVLQRLTHHKIIWLQPESHQFHTAAAECLNVGGRREAQQAGNFNGRRIFGIDGHVNSQVTLEFLQRGVILRIADTGNGVLHAQLSGRQAADHVHFIHIGDRNQKIGIFSARFPQDRTGNSVSLDCHNIQYIRSTAQRLLIGVHNGDIVIFLHQLLCQSKANLAVAYNYNFHRKLLSFCKRSHTPLDQIRARYIKHPS